MNDTSAPNHEGAPRRGREPRHFISLVEQLHRQAQNSRPRTDDERTHEAPLVAVTRRLVRATWLLVVVGLLSVVAAGLQWLALRSTDEKAGETIRVIREQADVMQGQLEDNRISQRPWIFLSALKPIGLFFVKDDISIPIHFALVNSGRTPGINTNISFTTVLMTRGQEYIVEEKIRRFCETQNTTKTAGAILTPPEKVVEIPGSLGLKISKADIFEGKEVAQGKEEILPFIGGCIHYNFAFGGTVHETGFIYQLLSPSTFIFLNDGNISSENLTLIEKVSGGWAN